ncbi:MAG: hypothetical protein ACE5I1_11830 [bacterium]
MAKGEVVYNGRPDKLISKAEGKVWQVKIEEADFSKVADKMQVISTINLGSRLLLRVVGEERANGYRMESVAPNLEDAYMYYMEAVAGERVDEDKLVEADV